MFDCTVKVGVLPDTAIFEDSWIFRNSLDFSRYQHYTIFYDVVNTLRSTNGLVYITAEIRRIDKIQSLHKCALLACARSAKIPEQLITYWKSDRETISLERFYKFTYPSDIASFLLEELEKMVWSLC